MAKLPSVPAPSELLCCEELLPFIDGLLKSSRSLRREGHLAEAERCALDVIRASQEPGTNISRASALIHLADIHRDMGKLGPALAECQRAHSLFQHQPSRARRHNEAVTAYALGLVHQLLGNEMDALKWYQEACQKFDRAKEDWGTVDDVDRVEICTHIRRWMEALAAHLTAVRTRGDAGLGTCLWIPVMLAEDEGPGFPMAELGIEKYIIGPQLRVNGESFQVQPWIGTARISLEPDGEFCALDIPDQVRESLGANEGDYALVVWKKDAGEVDANTLETLGEAQYGEFKRDIDGNFYFVRPVPRVIGGEGIEGDVQVGWVAALLKPE